MGLRSCHNLPGAPPGLSASSPHAVACSCPRLLVSLEICCESARLGLLGLPGGSGPRRGGQSSRHSLGPALDPPAEGLMAPRHGRGLCHEKSVQEHPAHHPAQGMSAGAVSMLTGSWRSQAAGDMGQQRSTITHLCQPPESSAKGRMSRAAGRAVSFPHCPSLLTPS